MDYSGGAGGLVALPVFKTVCGIVMLSRVGSIPTRSRFQTGLKSERFNPWWRDSSFSVSLFLYPFQEEAGTQKGNRG